MALLKLPKCLTQCLVKTRDSRVLAFIVLSMASITEIVVAVFSPRKCRQLILTLIFPDGNVGKHF